MSHVAVYKWIRKYIDLMQKYLEKIKPNVWEAWRTDELYLKIKGNMKYLYALMDDETRFWIAQDELLRRSGDTGNICVQHIITSSPSSSLQTRQTKILPNELHDYSTNGID